MRTGPGIDMRFESKPDRTRHLRLAVLLLSEPLSPDVPDGFRLNASGVLASSRIHLDAHTNSHHPTKEENK